MLVSALLLAGLVAPAHANGQTTHLWITWAAVDELEDGALKDLLSDEDNRTMLGNGTMFPDGGYAVGHHYGEHAHWPPFQERFAEWILDNFDGAYDGEAAPYWAFYFGMASHGMADEFFDALYMERSKLYDADAWASGLSLDTSSDFVWAGLTGAQTPPDFWLPNALVELFAAQGIEVDQDTIDDGQTALSAAIDVVGLAGEEPSYADLHAGYFPWGCAHLDSLIVPGAPRHEAKVVARYWESLWEQWHGATDLELIATVPDPGAYEHSDAIDDVESRVSLVFSRGMTGSDAIQEAVSIASDEGDHAFEADLFYGQHSHVVNLHATDGWAEDAEHLVTVDASLESVDGSTLAEDASFVFSTAGEPVVSEGCGCQTPFGSRNWAPIWALGLLGLAFRRRFELTV